ncbi:MAG TPA: TlyA family RNA methyltransferase [Terriglobia bacterium]|nr:TlyA family RNA methyltransferase [Terriglobia bacterium]
MAPMTARFSPRDPTLHAIPHRIRLDSLLVERGLAPSRQRAQALILAGQVLVDEHKVTKCGAAVRAAAGVRILGETPRYVSRAGRKLEAALDHFRVNPAGKVCLDIGASTGGFTDCLLQRGAARVFAVDAGTNQLDWRLRTDPRVVSLEKTNARYLELRAIGQPADLVTVDVSFISATLILRVVPALLKPQAEVLVLAKPQFEVGRGQVGKGGIVRDPGLRGRAVARVSASLEELGFSGIETAESVLAGVGGNAEYFVHALWGREAGVKQDT